MNSSVQQCVFLVGPTAIGKSRLALELAKRLEGSIANCDSLQLFQGLDIGTAKPTPEEQQQVPHYLFDMVPLGGTITAGQYRKKALEFLNNCSEKAVLFVGGSGFYFQALEKGMFELPPANPIVMAQLQEQAELQGPKALWDQLEQVDPESAQKIHPQDAYRLARALEVWISHQQKIDDFKKSFKPQAFPYPLKKLGLSVDRDLLRNRVKTRTQAMMEAGWVAEVEERLKTQEPQWAPLRSVGYKQVCDYVLGRLSKDRLIDEIITSTMGLAKRQMTWFKRDKDIHWLEVNSSSTIGSLNEQALRYLTS